MKPAHMKPQPEIRVTVLGARGSIPVSGKDFEHFGGSTSCYLVEAGATSIFLDAGSGLINAPVEFPNPPAILLTHLHLDHLLGLGMYKRLSRRGAKTDLYVPVESTREARKAMAQVYGTPYWPLKLTSYPSSFGINPFPSTMQYGEVTIDTIEGNHTGGSVDSLHPKGCICIKLSYGEKTLVYATDFEHNPKASKRLERFAQGTDLLLYDAQYSEEEYEAHRGYGHSTAQEGIKLKNRCGAKRLLLIHHDPYCTDADLLAREQALDDPDTHYAREGEVIEL